MKPAQQTRHRATSHSGRSSSSSIHKKRNRTNKKKPDGVPSYNNSSSPSATDSSSAANQRIFSESFSSSARHMDGDEKITTGTDSHHTNNTNVSAGINTSTSSDIIICNDESSTTRKKNSSMTREKLDHQISASEQKNSTAAAVDDDDDDDGPRNIVTASTPKNIPHQDDPKKSSTINNNSSKSKDGKLSLRHLPFRRDPFSEFIQSRLGTAFTIFLIALLCDIFLAKPILHQKGLTEVQLLQEIMQRTTGVNLENTLRFINASIPIGTADPRLRPGYTLSQQGASAKYPVVLIPGFITSGLELWQGEDCAKRHFRQRLWGSLPIFVQSFFTDMKCWSRHLALDPLTGGDPKNIKLRSAQGFEAADYFMSTYWVWDKIIENLSDVGYDSSNMIMMSYDWRLSFSTLEIRDGYLTKLKANIEAMVKTTGSRVAIVSHSMGSQIVLYFFRWVTTDEKRGGGGGGRDWVEKHCAHFVNIAGPLLGVPKAVPALLSGEMKDTAALLGPMGNMVERVFGKKDRKELWTTWGSLWEMLPKGGDAIWGPHDIITAQDQQSLTEMSELSERLCQNDLQMIDDAKDDFCQDNNLDSHRPLQTSSTTSHHLNIMVEGTTSKSDSDCRSCEKKSSFITFTQDDTIPSRENDTQQNSNSTGDDIMESEWSITDSINFLIKAGGGYGTNLYASKSISSRPESEIWNDPLVTPLPHAPSMKIYCLYGVGIETERAYFYKRMVPPPSTGDDSFPFVLDGTINDPENHIHFGSKSSDGDISVPLVSLGYLCNHKWKVSKELNPSDIHITTREYKHREEFQVNDPMRGGPYSSDHVDILGNVDAMTDLIKVVTDFEAEELQDRIVSDIESISKNINNDQHQHSA